MLTIVSSLGLLFFGWWCLLCSSFFAVLRAFCIIPRFSDTHTILIKKEQKSSYISSGRIPDSACVHIAKIKSFDSLELFGGGIGDLSCTMVLLATFDIRTSLNLCCGKRRSQSPIAVKCIFGRLGIYLETFILSTILKSTCICSCLL